MFQYLLFLPVLGSDVSKSVKCKSAWIKDFTADGTYRSAKLRKFIAVRVINAALAPCCLTPDILSFTLFLHEVPLPPSQGEGSITVKLPAWRAGGYAKADLITISAFTMVADAQVDAVTLVRHTVTCIYCEEVPKLCIHTSCFMSNTRWINRSIPLKAQQPNTHNSQHNSVFRVSFEGKDISVISIWLTEKHEKLGRLDFFFVGKKIFKLQLRGLALDQVTFQLVKMEFPTMTEITIRKNSNPDVHIVTYIISLSVNASINSNCLSVRVISKHAIYRDALNKMIANSTWEHISIPQTEVCLAGAALKASDKCNVWT